MQDWQNMSSEQVLTLVVTLASRVVVDSTGVEDEGVWASIHRHCHGSLGVQGLLQCVLTAISLHKVALQQHGSSTSDLSALLSSPKTSTSNQTHHPYTGNLISETSGDSDNTLLQCGDVLATLHMHHQALHIKMLPFAFTLSQTSQSNLCVHCVAFWYG